MPPRPRMRSMRYAPTRVPGSSNDGGSRNPSLSSWDLSSARTWSCTSAGSAERRIIAARSGGGVASARSNSAPTRCHRSGSFIRPCRGLVRLRRGFSGRIQLVLEPRAREGPVSLDRCRRHLQRLRDLFDGETAEVAQLDDLRLLGIEGGQFLERGVEREYVEAA